jgi:hypothetical protein
VSFSVKSRENFLGVPLSQVKPKNRFPHLLGTSGGVTEAAAAARALCLSANCLAPPRDRQRQESNPVDPCAHAAANIAYLYVLERGGMRY